MKEGAQGIQVTRRGLGVDVEHLPLLQASDAVELQTGGGDTSIEDLDTAGRLERAARPLTRKEREVLVHVIAGELNEQIATAPARPSHTPAAPEPAPRIARLAAVVH
jgi:hypothetical protein